MNRIPISSGADLVNDGGLEIDLNPPNGDKRKGFPDTLCRVFFTIFKKKTVRTSHGDLARANEK